ncbi:MAG: hypothetical protein ACJAU6_002314, partial [Alphaproteobacteria bacterium]
HMAHLTKRFGSAKGIKINSEIQESAPDNQFIRLIKSSDGHLGILALGRRVAAFEIIFAGSVNAAHQ